MKKRPLALLLVVAMLCALPGCDKGNPAEETGAPGPVKIGFSMATLLEDRWLRDRDIFLSKAQQRGMEVIIRNANKDSDLQYEQVLELLAQNIDVLVIAPNDTAKEARCVQAAKQAGVPVIVYDRFIQNSPADVYITFDNHMIGRLMGEYMLEHAPEGGYLLINGPQTDYNCILLREGYMEALQPKIDSGDIWILSETWAEGWVRERAYDFVTEKIWSVRSELVAAICQNDSLAWGVTDAFSEARVENVVVVGMDADLSACQRIVAGRQGMTVYKPIQNLVTKTLDACEVLAAGEVLVTEQTLFDGKNDVPYIAIEAYPVTIDTMDETVIEDGFHLKEEIYVLSGGE
ncbi:substrate-binding domain-containing protein [Christensenellaceae bacterium OttesenSCG-928-L17]|nr:substrate-binding domain-containing protein [Christensenellaceae bacterium OttesenSCG-928-L17]